MTTGRKTYTTPAIQTIPLRTELGRKLAQAFLNDRPQTDMGADYESIERRLLEHLKTNA